MCGRFVQKNLSEKIAAEFAAEDHATAWKPSFNIAPTTRIPVIRNAPSGRELIEMIWGLRPSWAQPDKKLPLMHNARSETVHKLPSYREAFKTRRGIVPASGYFEWKSGTPKQPFYFQRRDGRQLAIAAIWETNPDIGETVSLLTSSPNAEAGAVHDRMPVILTEDSWTRWLDPTPLSAQEAAILLEPAPDGLLELWPVDPAVGNVRKNSPDLLAPHQEDTFLF